jgi:sugar lactone lactonase YvrE
MKARIASAVLLLAAARAPLVAADFGPETIAEFSVKRAASFEFAEKPVVKRTGDHTDISFAVKAACDATVAIEDANGRIVRHLACGILGPHAPSPFQEGKLSQQIAWDGKDDFGRYVKDMDTCSVRVSLGLRAAFEKDLYRHPHRKLGNDSAIAIDRDGVYLYENNLNDYVKMYDHDGDYVRTLYPFAANQLPQILGLRWRSVPPAGLLVPDKKANRGESETTVTLLPINPTIFKVGNYYMGDMAVHDGLLHLFGHHVGRIGTDGTTRGQQLVGPACEIEVAKFGKERAHNIALSPDGKWAYMTRVVWAGGWAPYAHWPHAVYRMAMDGSSGPELFLGQPTRGSSNERFNSPMDVAVDAKGRIYVADWDNDRIQVFAPDGQYLRTIGEITGPSQVQVHPTSGEIYVFCWQARTKDHYGGPANRRYNVRAAREMLKFASLDSTGGRPKLLMKSSLSFAIPAKQRRRFGPTVFFSVKGNYDRCVVDFYSNPTRVWVVAGGGKGNRDSIYLLEEKDNQLVLKRNFDEEVAQAGYRQHAAWFQRQFLYFDPVREHLYLAEMDANEMKNFTGMIRIDIHSGERKWVKLPKVAADAAFDAEGRCYLRAGSTVTRYDPTDWREIPYDYGEQRDGSISLIPTIGGHGSSYKSGAFNVSPQGDAVVACVWGVKAEDRATVEKRRRDAIQKWTPQRYPGRPGGLFVHVYDRHGKLKHEDVIAGGGEFTGGLDMDWHGNLYANIRHHRILDGKPWGRSGTGTLAKFGSKGGRLLSDANPLVPLKEKPQRPKDVGGLWIPDAKWLYGDAATGSSTHCWCRHGRFRVDGFGRVFVPEADRYSIAVLDPNGRIILRIGQYGNADDGLPLGDPKPGVLNGDRGSPGIPRSIGGDEVGLFDAQFVTTQTDQRLFVADVGNGRVLAVKLEYEKTERVRLAEQE